ncbi:uncharacterized protein LACBIDRAFT_308897 [Laccaria bicolor S238N-H82]|uniref:Predicted protein n=1 Tax=Laccaria bicolor (strain S238N-H82 / ATCC MYA-4686) TaxID=486041 RepID=B0CV10_LACBS|nr:uncharacterized protein LACBIDRAFT_308897 [Laccaria bicolor S238N-H82]EDR13247.1 predicted protein [Laccaria bicolor S238N-H82]|eukprot:XP_001875745.1 predicted protein [Laccaria bicolor S238N-H82]
MMTAPLPLLAIPFSPPNEWSFKLPTCWSDQDCHSLLNVSLKLVEWTGALLPGDKNAAAATITCGIYCNEVEILGKEHKSFAGHGVKFSRLPGWEPNSWGYHGDDECSFCLEKRNIVWSDLCW